MSPQQDNPHRTPEGRFIGYLESLVPRDTEKDARESEHRAALATLRRGLGRPAGTVIEMYRYIGTYLPLEAKPWEEDAYFLVASLYALHPRHWPRQVGSPSNNLGASFRRLRQAEESMDSLEKRFTALLNASSETLEHHLRHAISLLRAGEEPVNYRQLLRDIQNWSRDDRSVQRQWAAAYWNSREISAPADTDSETATAGTATK